MLRIREKSTDIIAHTEEILRVTTRLTFLVRWAINLGDKLTIGGSRELEGNY